MKISKLTSIAFCCVLAASCTGNRNAANIEESFVDPFDYTLTVTNIDASDGTVIRLYDTDALAGSRSLIKEALIDSAVIVDSTAVFDIKGSAAPVAMLNIQDGPKLYVFPEPGENTYDYAGKTGSGNIAGKYNAYNEKLKAIYAQVDSTVPEAGTPEYAEFVDSVENLLSNLSKRNIEENLDNGFGIFLLWQSAQEMSAEELDSIIAASPRLANSKRIKQAKEDLKKLAATSVGQTYTDFTIDNDSASVSLSDYVKPGQYILVDFWASWCGPCKRAIASLKKNYDELHAKGLNVVGVAVWEDAEATKAWLSENPLPWDIILDAQTVPTDIYAIKGIPTLVLIGPDGKILARSYSEEEVVDAFNAAVNSSRKLK